MYLPNSSKSLSSPANSLSFILESTSRKGKGAFPALSPRGGSREGVVARADTRRPLPQPARRLRARHGGGTRASRESPLGALRVCLHLGDPHQQLLLTQAAPAPQPPARSPPRPRSKPPRPLALFASVKSRRTAAPAPGSQARRSHRARGRQRARRSEITCAARLERKARLHLRLRLHMRLRLRRTSAPWPSAGVTEGAGRTRPR